MNCNCQRYGCYLISLTPLLTFVYQALWLMQHTLCSGLADALPFLFFFFFFQGFRQLRLLVENRGRVNYGLALNEQRKGKLGSLFL